MAGGNSLVRSNACARSSAGTEEEVIFRPVFDVEMFKFRTGAIIALPLLTPKNFLKTEDVQNGRL